MKTNYLTRSKAFTTVAAAVLLNLSSFGQTQSDPGIIWATITDPELIINSNQTDRPGSSHTELDAIFDQMNVFSIQQVAPNSKNPENQQVYEFQCNCDEQDLYKSMAEISDLNLRPEIGPHYELMYTPDDYTISYTQDYALDLIQATAAWDISTGDTSVIIAISDSNFDPNHEELQGTYDLYVSNTNPNTIHGTAVATTAAGGTNNGIGKSAIGFNSHMQLRPMSYGQLIDATYSGAKVINVSWASGCAPNVYVQNIVDEIYNNGTVIIAAAGNGTTCGGPTAYVYPAACENVIAVTSVGPTFNHERIIGDPNSTHQHNDKVDLSAPGYDVPLTIAAGTYTYSTGTSFAAPLVSGVVGLMYAVNPCLTPDEVLDILEKSATDIDQYNPNYSVTQIGAGTLNAAAALALTVSDYAPSINVGTSCLTGLGFADIQWPNAAAFDVQWNTGGNETHIEGLETDQYWVTITREDGCQISDDFYIETTQPTAFEVDQMNPSCWSYTDGMIEINPINPNTTFTWTWSSGDSTNAAYNLAEGLYSVHTEGASGCIFDTSVVLIAPDQLTLEETVIPNNAFVVANGGTAPYQYYWSSGETTPDLINVMGGWYDLEVFDLNGCEAYLTVYILPGQLETSTAGITDIDEANGMLLYPNPTKDETTLHITGKDCDEVQIFDMFGQLLRVIPVAPETSSVEIDELPSGSYMVRALNAGQMMEVLRLQIMN